jgi:UDP-N-acetylglucosamine:LPS N-acetylglucosamine transferase
MNVLILHYTHPEGYPPTLNAINCIAKQVKKVTVLSTATLTTKWNYDENVKLILIENGDDRFQEIKHSNFDKIKFYFKYIFKLYQLLTKESYDLVLIYDNVPFFFYTIVSFFIKKRFKLWYHNHDVYPISDYKKYTINWFAAIIERKSSYFNSIDYFSLPAIERKAMYPLENYKGKFFFIPNYPSKRMIDYDTSLKKDENNIQIVYPGSASHKNGFYELMEVMNQKVNNKIITLTLIGDVHQKFRTDLLAYAKNKGVERQLFFKERIPYMEMTTYLKKFQIGWALYKPVDLSVATAGTSSNKIYEFLANGLPIIVFDNEHHHTHLDSCKAAFFSKLERNSIIDNIKIIDANFEKFTKIAKEEFEKNYQFEFKFDKIFHEIKKEIE